MSSPAEKFQELVDIMHKIPWGFDMQRETIKDVLKFFASSVNLHAQPGDEWQPSEHTKKPEGAIQNASKLGLLATTPDEGTIIVTVLGLKVKEKIVEVFSN